MEQVYYTREADDSHVAHHYFIKVIPIKKGQCEFRLVNITIYNCNTEETKSHNMYDTSHYIGKTKKNIKLSKTYGFDVYDSISPKKYRITAQNPNDCYWDIDKRVLVDNTNYDE